MTEKQEVAKRRLSADWFMRGALSRIGDSLDRLIGRNWTASSSLATSELIERMKKLLDAEVREVPGKGKVVPHSIKLKMQWDKFATDSDKTVETLEKELLTAAADHINDSLYFTYAPLRVQVKPDYFTEGVKLYVGFDSFAEEEPEVSVNVTIAGIQIDPESGRIAEPVRSAPRFWTYLAKYVLKGAEHEKRLIFQTGRRVSVGRTPNNDLALADTEVSKFHASLVVNADGKLAVADTGSTNGTFINGERIAYGKASTLEEGDRVKFGSIEVILTLVESSGPEIELQSPETEPNAAVDGGDTAQIGDVISSEQSLSEAEATENTDPAHR